MYAFITLLLVTIIGAGAGYWAIKKVRDKRNNKEIRCEIKRTLMKEGVNAEELKEAMLSAGDLDDVIAKHDLLSHWGFESNEDAKARIRKKFTVKINGLELILGYQDKNSTIAQGVLESLMQSFAEKQRAGP